jgi:hypothetical protein
MTKLLLWALGVCVSLPAQDQSAKNPADELVTVTATLVGISGMATGRCQSDVIVTNISHKTITNLQLFVEGRCADPTPRCSTEFGVEMLV